MITAQLIYLRLNLKFQTFIANSIDNFKKHFNIRNLLANVYEPQQLEEILPKNAYFM